MRLMVSAALCALMLSASAAAAFDGGPRLRPQDPRLKDVLREGISRSATFRSLVERIDKSDVIVYLALNPLIRSNLSGTLTWMTRAGGYRYVRASISPDQSFDQMIATVAHELQHALEVVGDANVTDEDTLVDLYRRIGDKSTPISRNSWETIAAQQTGSQVRRELANVAASVTMARTGDRTRM